MASLTMHFNRAALGLAIASNEVASTFDCVLK
jgi:hypothetical protein